MKLQLAKGMKDSLPEEKIGQQRLMDELRKTFELCGFSPLETPAVERFDVLASKYTGGAEILKETFKVNDQGNRELALRYDLTVPFARVVGMNPQLKMPFKRYQMDKVWRDGPIGLGRYREFWQCDVDVVGAKSMIVDAEILSIVKVMFDKFELDYNIELNNRKLLNGILGSVGISDDKKIDMILIIDKIKKISAQELKDELIEAGMNEEQVDTINTIFNFKGNNLEKLEEAKKIITTEEGLEGVKELEDLFRYLDAYDVKKYTLELSLSRGLAYYTGTVFETSLVNNKITSSVASGGRYDKMIGNFLETKNPFPCVGISFGLSRIYDAIKEREEVKQKTVTKLFLVPIKTEVESIRLTQKLRYEGINTEMGLPKRNITKNLNYANALNIPFAMFVGENELAENKFKLKNMISGEEELLSFEEIVAKMQ